MTRKCNLNHRLIACILLVNLFLQSCLNQSIPPMGLERKHPSRQGSIKEQPLGAASYKQEQAVQDTSIPITVRKDLLVTADKLQIDQPAKSTTDSSIQQSPTSSTKRRSDNPTVKKSVQEKRTKTTISAGFNQLSPIKTQLNKESIWKFKTRQGQLVRIYQQGEKYQAKVIEKIGKFKGKPHLLPVYFEPGMDLKQLTILPQPMQEQYIHVVLPKPSVQQAGYVYVGKMVILGGGKKNERKEKKNEEGPVKKKAKKEKKDKNKSNKKEDKDGIVKKVDKEKNGQKVHPKRKRKDKEAKENKEGKVEPTKKRAKSEKGDKKQLDKNQEGDARGKDDSEGQPGKGGEEREVKENSKVNSLFERGKNAYKLYQNEHKENLVIAIKHLAKAAVRDYLPAIDLLKNINEGNVIYDLMNQELPTSESLKTAIKRLTKVAAQDVEPAISLVKKIKVMYPELVEKEEEEKETKTDKRKGSDTTDQQLIRDKGKEKVKEKEKVNKNSRIEDSKYATSKAGSSSQEGYMKAGVTNAFHGIIYQLKLLMLFLQQGLNKDYEFHLSTERVGAGKFDDIVFKYKKRDEEKFTYRYLQAKHKQDSKLTITDNDLLTEKDGDFSLLKYFISYLEIKKNPDFKDGELGEFTLYTNIDFELDKEKDKRKLLKLTRAFTDIPEKDPILDTDENTARRCKFGEGFTGKGKKKLYEILQRASDLIMLANVFNELVNKNNIVDKLELRSRILQKHHRRLINDKVIIKKRREVESIRQKGRNKGEPVKREYYYGTFSKDFIDKDEKNLSEWAKKLRTYFTDEQITKLKNKEFQLSEDFGVADKYAGLEAEPMEEIKKEDIDDFLDHLVFAVNQPNEVKLEDIIANKLGIQFNLINDDLIYAGFQHKVLNWMKDKAGKTLTRTEAEQFFDGIKQQIATLVLIGPTEAYCRKLEEFGVEYKELEKVKEFLEKKEENKPLHLMMSGNPKLGAIRVLQTLQKIGFEQDGSYTFIDLKSARRLKDRLKTASGDSQDKPLIVVCHNNTKFEELEPILSALEINSNNKRKIILISSEQPSLPGMLNQDISCGHADLTSKSQEKIADSPIIFQGNTTRLGELLKTQELNNIIIAEILLDLIRGNEIKIGNSLQPTIENFVKRRFNRDVRIKRKCLRENTSDIFVITGINTSKLKSLIPDDCNIYTSLEKEKTLEDIIGLLVNYNRERKVSDKRPPFILLKEDNKAKFIELYKSYKSEDNLLQSLSLHLLKFQDEDFIWQETQGSIFSLNEYLRKTSLEEENLFKNNALATRLTIIAGEPGMGKSTIAVHLANEISRKDSLSLVVPINLIEYIPQLEEAKFEKLANVIDFIETTPNIFSRKIIEYYLSIPDKVTVIFDGFDEIHFEQQSKIIDAIKLLTDQTKGSVLITTRLRLRETLEKEFNTFSYDLKKLNEKEVKEFINKVWTKGLSDQEPLNDDKFNTYADSLIRLFDNSIKDNYGEFIGIPLQAELLAEAFGEDFKKFHESSVQEPILPKKLSIYSLYKRFINARFDIFLKDKTRVVSYNSSNFIRSSLIRTLTKIHQVVACKLLFPKYTLKKVKDEDILNLVGIVQVLSNVPIFLHLTFAEYFIANFFAENLKKPAEHPEYKKTKDCLVRNIFKKDNHVIRTFLEERIKIEQNEQLSEEWEQVKKAVVISGKTNEHLIIHETEAEKQRVYHATFERLKTKLKELYEFETMLEELEKEIEIKTRNKKRIEKNRKKNRVICLSIIAAL